MKELIALYRQKLLEADSTLVPCPVFMIHQEGEVPFPPRAVDEHLLHMMTKMPGMYDGAFDTDIPDFYDPDAMMKFNRWLGFIQGVLWLKGTYTLNQLRDQTRAAVARMAVEADQKAAEELQRHKRRNMQLTGAD